MEDGHIAFVLLQESVIDSIDCGVLVRSTLNVIVNQHSVQYATTLVRSALANIGLS